MEKIKSEIFFEVYCKLCTAFNSETSFFSSGNDWVRLEQKFREIEDKIRVGSFKNVDFKSEWDKAHKGRVTKNILFTLLLLGVTICLGLWGISWIFLVLGAGTCGAVCLILEERFFPSAHLKIVLKKIYSDFNESHLQAMETVIEEKIKTASSISQCKKLYNLRFLLANACTTSLCVYKHLEQIDKELDPLFKISPIKSFWILGVRSLWLWGMSIFLLLFTLFISIAIWGFVNNGQLISKNYFYYVSTALLSIVGIFFIFPRGHARICFLIRLFFWNIGALIKF